MRTPLENLASALVTEGWANQSDGEVDAPSGHFAIIDATTEREIMADLTEYVGEDFSAVPAAWLLVEHDDQGFVTVTECDSEADAQARYAALEAIYVAWDSATEEEV